MNKKLEKVYYYLLLTLVMIQPVLDIRWLNDGTLPDIVGFTIPTLVRIGLIMILAVLSFFVIKFNKKYWILIAYLALIGLYFIGHHYNCLQFHSVVPGDFNYSLISELLYIVRMCIPISVIYFTYNSKINKETFEKCVIGIAMVMSLSIVLTNLFMISYGSYTGELISGNIIDWFIHQEDFISNQLASKGWFYMSITSTVMVLTYPYLFYVFAVKKKVWNFLAILIQAIALLMIGTKATAFSVIIVSVLMAVIYLVTSILKHDTGLNRWVCIGMIVIIVVSFGVYRVSPSTMKMQFDEQYSEEMDEEDSNNERKEPENETEEELIRFFNENYKDLSIKTQFLEDSYPYQYDPVFWYDLYKNNPPSVTMQNRTVEEKMLQRVKEINNNKGDNWFGIGFTRTSHIYNLEKDFLYQYYSVGVLGVILLLGPYIGIIVLMIVLMLLKFKEKATMYNCSFVLGVGLSCFVAYYSGNAIENLGITIWLGFMLGFLLKSNFRKEIKSCENNETE